MKTKKKKTKNTLENLAKKIFEESHKPEKNKKAELMEKKINSIKPENLSKRMSE